jgi:hypothetical protein
MTAGSHRDLLLGKARSSWYLNLCDEMKSSYAKTLFSLTILSLTAASISDATPSRIEAEIQTRGAASVLKKYFNGPSWGETILDPIKTASPSGLRVAELLVPVSDGDSGEELGEALYEGLAVAPQKVLPVIMRVYKTSAKEACDVSFEASEPKGGADAYLSRIERKLPTSLSGTQARIWAQCRLGLKHSRELARQNGLIVR